MGLSIIACVIYVCTFYLGGFVYVSSDMSLLVLKSVLDNQIRQVDITNNNNNKCNRLRWITYLL